MNYKDKTVIVFDYGDHTYIAERIAEDFGTVYYYIPFQKAYPDGSSRLVGTGLKNVTRIYSFWSVLPEADVIVFPDLFQGDLQCYLRDEGYNVFGSFMGEELEIYRPELKQLFKDVGLPVGEYEVAYGLDDLKEKLKDKKDVWIKLNGYLRGIKETWHYDDATLSEPIFAELAHALGRLSKTEPFIIESTIPCDKEIGWDGWVVNGEFPKSTMIGYESKDSCYIGRKKDYNSLPEPIKRCNDKLIGVFEDYGYQGCYSNEIRIDKRDGEPYLGDSTNRFPSPPGSLYTLIYSNFSDIIWGVSHGKMVQPEYKGSFGVEVIIKSDWATEEEQPIYFPEEIRPYIRIKNHAIIDGVDYYIPQKNGMKEIGSLIFVSESLDDAILEIKYMAKKIKGYGLKIDADLLDKAYEEITNFEKQSGIKIITDAIKG